MTERENGDLETESRNVPEVRYIGDINKPESPYNLQITGPLFGKLLQEELSLPVEMVERVRVLVRGPRWDREEPPELIPDALEYAKSKRRIILDTDRIIGEVRSAQDDFIRYSRVIKREGEHNLVGEIKEKIFRGRSESQESTFLQTSRLLPYLRVAEEDRVEAFLDKLLPSVVERYALYKLVSGANRVVEVERERLKAFNRRVMLPLGAGSAAYILNDYLLPEGTPYDVIKIGFGINWAAVFYWSSINSARERANKFAEGVKAKHEWRNVVIFEPQRQWNEL